MTATAPAGPAVPVRRGTRPVALATLCAVLFLTFLDNTVVSVALGSVQADLHAWPVVVIRDSVTGGLSCWAGE
jgi:hypothetical protein